MLSLTVKEMRGHGRRLVGTAVAVFLGVAFLAGTLVLGDTLRNNFDNLFADVNAGTDVVVRNATDLGIEADEPRGLIDRSLVDRVAAVDGVAAAEPQIQGLGQLLGADGDAVGGSGPPQLAGSWTTDDGAQPLPPGRGPGPRGRRRGRDQPRRRRRRRPADRRPHHRAHPRAGRGDHRGHLDVRRAGRARRRHVHRLQPRGRDAATSPRTPTACPPSPCGRPTARRRTSSSPASTTCCPTASRRCPARPCPRRTPTTSTSCSSTC